MSIYLLFCRPGHFEAPRQHSGAGRVRRAAESGLLATGRHLEHSRFQNSAVVLAYGRKLPRGQRDLNHLPFPRVVAAEGGQLPLGLVEPDRQPSSGVVVAE